MSETEGRNALLGSLLSQHGEVPAPQVTGPIVPDSNLSHLRHGHSPFDLVSFLESQRGHPPSLDTNVLLSDSQGHLVIRGLKSTKIAFGKLVKAKTWGWVDSSTTSALSSAYFSILCGASSGCTLVRTGEASSAHAVNLTARPCFFREADPGRHAVVYMFLAWTMKFDGILFSGKKRSLGFLYVYVRNCRASRFNYDGFLLAWLPEKLESFSCTKALHDFLRVPGGLLSTVSAANPIPIPPNVISACKEQRPHTCADAFWDVVMLPLRHASSDALQACTLSKHTALAVAARYVLHEFYPHFADASALALVIAWGAHDLQGGTSPYLAVGSPLYASAAGYLGTNANNRSLVPYMFEGAPPEFVRYVWNAGPRFKEIHDAFLGVVLRETHIERTVASLSGNDRWNARLRALVEIGKLVLHELRGLLKTSKRAAKLGARWRALLPLIAGNGVEKTARMLETTPRLRIDRQTLVNLIAYTDRQVKGIAAVLSDDSELDGHPGLALGLVWVYTQADATLALDKVKAAAVEGSDTVLAHYRRLFANAHDLALQQARGDTRITAEHFAATARVAALRNCEARKRKREFEQDIERSLADIRAAGDSAIAVRVLKTLAKKARELDF